ncbi:hypothetical protein Hanom_Chr07g00616871 [Helianthus anomalus]
MTTENLTKMADQVMMEKALEVDSKSASDSGSSGKVSSSGSDSEPGKAGKAKSESDCRNCMKECKVCNTYEYLSRPHIQELTNKINILNKEVIGRDKLVKSSTDIINELTEKIKSDENDVERFRKENEKLMLEKRKISEDFDKLKRTIKDSDERNSKTHKENSELSGVLQAKEKQINAQLDENVNLKLQHQEAKIENERINLKLNIYTSASFVLQHIVPKPIGKNKDGEDVYSDGTGVGYHKVPPSMSNNFTKKQSGLVNESDLSEKSDAEMLPDNIDVMFNSKSDKDSIKSKVVKDVVEKVLRSNSDSTDEDDDCFLNNYIPKPKSQINLEDEPTLVMYKMNGSDKLYSDKEFPIENVNVDKLKKVFKLVEIDVSEVNGLLSLKRFLNFQRDKSYYNQVCHHLFTITTKTEGLVGIWVVRIIRETIFRNQSL